MPQQTDTVVITRRIKAQPSVVFAYFTERDRWLEWKGVGGDVDPVVGGRYRIEVLGDRHVASGTFLAIEPPTRIVFSWGWEGESQPVPAGSSVVEVVLEPDGEETVLRLTHHDLPVEERASHAVGWEHYLDRLELRASGRDPGPDEWLTRASG